MEGDAQVVANKVRARAQAAIIEVVSSNGESIVGLMLHTSWGNELRKPYPHYSAPKPLIRTL